MRVIEKGGSPAPDVSYHPNEVLVRMIVQAWTDKNFYNALVKDKTKEIFEQAGLHIGNPVVVEESGRDYQKKSNDEVVFVLPAAPKPLPKDVNALLETARLKMAYTIRGI